MNELRKEGQFNLEQLRQAHKVTIEDCQNFFDYSKLLFEMQKYESKWITASLTRDQSETHSLLSLFRCAPKPLLA